MHDGAFRRNKDSPGSIVRSSISGCRPLDPGSNPGQGATSMAEPRGPVDVFFTGLSQHGFCDQSNVSYVFDGNRQITDGKRARNDAQGLTNSAIASHLEWARETVIRCTAWLGLRSFMASGVCSRSF